MKQISNGKAPKGLNSDRLRATSTAAPQAVRIGVRVTPRASRNEATAYIDGVLHLRLTAPPVDGAANEACCALVADLLGIAASRVSITLGASSRNKVLAVAEVAQDDVERMLSAAGR